MVARIQTNRNMPMKVLMRNQSQPSQSAAGPAQPARKRVAISPDTASAPPNSAAWISANLTPLYSVW